jgi:hypothetical protein
MEKVYVKGNYKILIAYYALLAFCGLLISGVHLYDFFTGDLDEMWYLDMPTVILALFAVGYALGFMNPYMTEIIIDDEGIRSNKSAWDSSFAWEKLKLVELHKNKIQIQYAKTGLKNEIVIPYMIHIQSANLKKLNDGLTEYCEKNGVEFSSKIETNLNFKHREYE